MVFNETHVYVVSRLAVLITRVNMVYLHTNLL